MAGTIDRDTLLGSFQRRYRTVETLFGQVRIRNMTEREKADFEAGGITADGKINLRHIRNQRRRLVAFSVVDDQGVPLLQPGDEDRLGDIDAAVTTAIFEAAREHCGFSAEEAEELEKNSSTTTADN